MSQGRLATRGLPFRLALRMDWSTALVAEDSRKDYGEQRFQAMGLIGDRLHVLLFTPRPPAMHVISLRKANKREEARYDAKTKS
ncbi:MAG: BrnT family toxin [Burkholderiaceae bacterium]